MTTRQQQLYPLAAMCQAAQLVMQLAVTGTCDEKAFQTQVDSLFIFDPLKTSDIYGTTNNLPFGLAYLTMALPKPIQILRSPSLPLLYSFCRYAKKIRHSPKIQKTLFEQLSRIQQQTSYFGSTQHPHIMNNLADMYLTLASTLRLRLKIAGHKKHLHNSEVLTKIRVLLFSGVRAAVLWYQLKGHLPKLLWQRKKFIQEAKIALAAFEL